MLEINFLMKYVCDEDVGLFLNMEWKCICFLTRHTLRRPLLNWNWLNLHINYKIGLITNDDYEWRQKEKIFYNLWYSHYEYYNVAKLCIFRMRNRRQLSYEENFLPISISIEWVSMFCTAQSTLNLAQIYSIECSIQYNIIGCSLRGRAANATMNTAQRTNSILR